MQTIILVGLFSAKVRDYESTFDEIEARLKRFGVTVAGRFVQRRGVSDGGVRLMNSPYLRRYVIRSGKLQQVAIACEIHDADTVIFFNELNSFQRRSLSLKLGCEIVSIVELDGLLPGR